MKRIALILIIGLMITGFSFCLEIGDDAAGFANMDLTGKFVFSKDYIGEEWVIVDFFATYCIPCKEEIPELEVLMEEFGDISLNCFVMATDKDGGSIVEPYFRETPTTLTVLIDRYMVTAKRYGVDSIPTVFLINPEGKIEFKAIGYSKEAIEEIRTILTNAFSG